MNIDTDKIRKQYDANIKDYEKLAEWVERELKKSIYDRGFIKIHAITHRIKGLNSLKDKIRRKDLEKPFEQVLDIVGLRVVCLFRSDIEKINKIIHNIFEVSEEDNKTNNSESNTFGYMSLHLKCRIKSSTKNDLKQDIFFEIQVRTMAQDAWASISHYLYYKENCIPPLSERDFYALSGLFYLADTQFSFLRQQYNKPINPAGDWSANFVADSRWEVDIRIVVLLKHATDRGKSKNEIISTCIYILSMHKIIMNW